jgi:hypothetical protein
MLVEPVPPCAAGMALTSSQSVAVMKSLTGPEVIVVPAATEANPQRLEQLWVCVSENVPFLVVVRPAPAILYVQAAFAVPTVQMLVVVLTSLLWRNPDPLSVT